MDLTSAVRLNNGVEMPWVGFGTFKSEPGRVTEQAVAWALEIGYRHVDTAAFYGNEADVGRAVRASSVPRPQVFITTKVWNADQGYEQTLRAFEESSRKLGLDVVDLYLIHWPVKGKFSDTWRAMEKLYADGRVRAIGVSNFKVHHLEELAKTASVMPAVNQVEFHPFLLQPELLAYDQANGIRHEAWSPLTRGRSLENPVIVRTARAHGRTPAQVLLRWDLQHGVATIPKSVHRERILENSALFDFELTPAEIAAIDGLDTGTRIGPDPDKITF
ncbi:MAG: glyoxal reductase [Spirochaetes bacterium RBG_13_68_11]|nr:MAG: glyoxal reductase [Spirochaetes bacterium RBG_13_68_11]